MVFKIYLDVALKLIDDAESNQGAMWEVIDDKFRNCRFFA
jgi:hypothetical protein